MRSNYNHIFSKCYDKSYRQLLLKERTCSEVSRQDRHDAPSSDRRAFMTGDSL